MDETAHYIFDIITLKKTTWSSHFQRNVWFDQCRIETPRLPTNFEFLQTNKSNCDHMSILYCHVKSAYVNYVRSTKNSTNGVWETNQDSQGSKRYTYCRSHTCPDTFPLAKSCQAAISSECQSWESLKIKLNLTHLPRGAIAQFGPENQIRHYNDCG